MNPFDSPPSTPPVGFDPPQLIQPPSRRGRMVVVALASAGLVVGGVAVVSQLASADRPQTVAAGSTEPIGSVPPPAPQPTAPPTTGPATDVPDIAGQITIDIGGEPITFDLGEISECIGDLGIFDGPMLDGPMFDGELPALPEIVQRGEGSVTVAGPDGLSVIEFGEGDGSVTITRENGELTVTSEGDVDVHQLDDLFGEFPAFDIEQGGEPGAAPDGEPHPVPNFPDFEQLHECLDGVD